VCFEIVIAILFSEHSGFSLECDHHIESSRTSRKGTGWDGNAHHLRDNLMRCDGTEFFSDNWLDWLVVS